VSDLLQRQHWIFDLDGTLTLAIHDFDALRRDLGLPPGAPILEACQQRPNSEALLRQVDDWERALVERARPAPDALTLLSALHPEHTLGVLTRNTHEHAMRTLQVTGLARFFADEVVIGRDQALPKPNPAGIYTLLRNWSAEASDAVMVGDHPFDLDAGTAAGTATVWVDRTHSGDLRPRSDRRVTALHHLLPVSPTD
jgi:HAD superfamily hydrolase (TIGR01509 family)